MKKFAIGCLVVVVLFVAVGGIAGYWLYSKARSYVGQFQALEKLDKGVANVSAFTAPAAYTFGNAGRNILTGPGFAGVDFGLSRFFTIHENHKLQFRSEFFNLFNRSNWGTPGATVGNSAFGTIRSTSAAFPAW